MCMCMYVYLVCLLFIIFYVCFSTAHAKCCAKRKRNFYVCAAVNSAALLCSAVYVCIYVCVNEHACGGGRALVAKCMRMFVYTYICT